MTLLASIHQGEEGEWGGMTLSQEAILTNKAPGRKCRETKQWKSQGAQGWHCEVCRTTIRGTSPIKNLEYFEPISSFIPIGKEVGNIYSIRKKTLKYLLMFKCFCRSAKTRSQRILNFTCALCSYGLFIKIGDGPPPTGTKMKQNYGCSHLVLWTSFVYIYTLMFSMKNSKAGLRFWLQIILRVHAVTQTLRNMTGSMKTGNTSAWRERREQR